MFGEVGSDDSDLEAKPLNPPEIKQIPNPSLHGPEAGDRSQHCRPLAQYRCPQSPTCGSQSAVRESFPVLETLSTRHVVSGKRARHAGTAPGSARRISTLRGLSRWRFCRPFDTWSSARFRDLWAANAPGPRKPARDIFRRNTLSVRGLQGRALLDIGQNIEGALPRGLRRPPWRCFWRLYAAQSWGCFIRIWYCLLDVHHAKGCVRM